MKITAHCKFCKIPLTLDIDDEYMKLGDPHKLIPLAACNNCADMRVLRRKLESKIRLTCRCYQLGMNNETLKSSTRKALTLLTQDYSRLITRWHGMDGMAWEEGIVDAILDNPQQWGDIVGRMWRIAREQTKRIIE